MRSAFSMQSDGCQAPITSAISSQLRSEVVVMLVGKLWKSTAQLHSLCETTIITKPGWPQHCSAKA